MRVFISYAEKPDKNKKEVLKKSLTKAGFEYIPVVDVQSNGLEFRDKVRQALNKADYVIPVITKGSILNQWVNQEIGYAESSLGRTKIYALVADNALSKMKGFLIKDEEHFVFTSSKNPRSESKTFGTKCDELINALRKISRDNILFADAKVEKFNKRVVTAFSPPTDLNLDAKVSNRTVFNLKIILSKPKQIFRAYIRVKHHKTGQWKWFQMTNADNVINDKFERIVSEPLLKRSNFELILPVARVIESDSHLPKSNINEYTIDRIRFRGDKMNSEPIVYLFELDENYPA